jgi:CubicO group peptidase (beta-lactamase class C family)
MRRPYLFFPLVFLVTLNAAAKEFSSRIDSLFIKYDGTDVPGASVMIIKDGKVIYKRGYGLADLEAKEPVTPSACFRLASVTKQFTAMSVMILAGRKKLSYDNTLSDYFPDFPSSGKKITVRHLLNHVSGLIAYEDVMPESTMVPLLDNDVLALLKKKDSTYFAPGAEYRYSNSGYALLALIVEKVSGMSFAQFLRENIFAPLQMTSSVAYEKGISTVPNRAYGYSLRDSSDEKSFIRTDQSMTSSVLGDGGIYSSTEDLFKWDQSLYTTKLVSSTTLDQAFTPNILHDGKNSEYGFGWRISTYRETRCLHHSGSTIGFRNEIQRYPEKHFSVIVLTNRDDGDPGALAYRIADICLFGL